MIYSTPVVDNIYASDIAPPAGSAIVALAADGGVLSSISLRPGG